jgi:hypothetical protein
MSAYIYPGNICSAIRNPNTAYYHTMAVFPSQSFENFPLFLQVGADIEISPSYSESTMRLTIWAAFIMYKNNCATG